jgi:hypothetical protein
MENEPIDKLAQDATDDYNKNVGIFIVKFSQVEIIYTHFLARSYTFEFAKYNSLVKLFEEYTFLNKCKTIRVLLKYVKNSQEISDLIKKSESFATTRNTLVHGIRFFNLNHSYVQTKDTKTKKDVINSSQLIKELNDITDHLKDLIEVFIFFSDEIRAKLEQKKHIPYPAHEPGYIFLL